MLYQSLLAGMGAFGFAALFSVKGKKKFIIMISSSSFWYIYLLFEQWIHSKEKSVFFITFMIVVFSTVIAKKIECPTIMLSVPILIPFIPGAALFYTMNGLICYEMKIFMENGQQLIVQIVGMALGIICAETVIKIIGNGKD